MSILDEQRQLYSRQTSELNPDQWQHDHERAMCCRNVEDVIRYGLMLLATIRRHNDVWAREVSAGATEFSWDTARDFAEHYSWWLKKTKAILQIVHRCETQCCFEVEGADELRQEFQEVSLMSLDTERAKQSIMSLDAGEGISAEQAMNVLRDHLR